MVERDNMISESESVDEKKSKTGRPLVSIITPVLNSIKYLEICIQSVLDQSYPYIEHIFVDGGSTDGTLDILTSYKDRYPGRIRFVSEQDKGTGEAWNKGLRMAKGVIFGWLGSDDTYEKDAVLAVVEFFKSNPNAYFVFGGCDTINEKGEIIGKSTSKDFNLEEIINKGNYVPATSSFYRREIIEKVGLYDNIHGNDLDYLIRVAKVFQIHRIEKVLSNFRIHRESATTGSGSKTRILLENYIVSKRHGGHIFSAYGRRYFTTVIIERLQPILGRVYPFMKQVGKRMKSKLPHCSQIWDSFW